MESNKSKKTLASNPIIKAIGVQRLVVIAVIIILYAFFYAASVPFRKYTTLIQICSYMYYILLMAIGVTFPLITGGTDLSMGTGLICYSVVGSYLIRINGWPVWAAMIVTIAMGVLVGFINGNVIARLELPPFITTLSTMMICRGMGAILTNSFSGTWPAMAESAGWFRKIFKYVTPDRTIIPTGLILMVILIAIMTFVLNHTRVGRYTIAIGSNKEALKLSGVNVVKWHVIAYMISGFFVGLAAIAYAGTFSNITPGTGAGFELDAIGGAIIGGTAMTGGSGSIIGTFLGVLLLSLLKTGLPFIGLQANWQQVITGCILLVAVTIDMMRNSKRA